MAPPHLELVQRTDHTNSTKKGGHHDDSSGPSPIIFWVVVLVVLIGIAVFLMVASRLGWIRPRNREILGLRNVRFNLQHRQVPPPPPPLSDLEEVAPAIKCEKWLKRRAAAALGVDSSGAETDQPGEDLIDCAICLKSMDLGEQVRELPCHHMFHKDCIDEYYLLNHMNCPLCRKVFIEPKPAATEGSAEDAGPSTGTPQVSQTASTPAVEEVQASREPPQVAQNSSTPEIQVQPRTSTEPQTELEARRQEQQERPVQAPTG